MRLTSSLVTALLLPLTIANPVPEPGAGPETNKDTIEGAISGASIAPQPIPNLFISNLDAKEVLPNSYIVVYKKDAKDSAVKEHETKGREKLKKIKNAGKFKGVQSSYNFGNGQFRAIAVETDLEGLAALKSPDVDYVALDQIGKVPNQKGNITEVTGSIADFLIQWPSSTWGLGRISHRLRYLYNYIFDNTQCAGTRVYVLDTGIRTTHAEFKNGGSTTRAFWGANFYPGTPNMDDNGHGTHCAGTIGGYKTGVCLKTQLVAVKVCNSAGSCPSSYLMNGMTWAANHAFSQGMQTRSVFSISLGYPYFAPLNQAVTAIVNRGIPVVVAAGNENTLACTRSPASAPGTITVGATDINDSRATFSNYGGCVDIFGPGVSVWSTWSNCDTCYNTISGTSMATPHVAGMAAYFIAKDKIAGGPAVLSKLTSWATLNKITSVGAGSPNRLAYNGNGN